MGLANDIREVGKDCKDPHELIRAVYEASGNYDFRHAGPSPVGDLRLDIKPVSPKGIFSKGLAYLEEFRPGGKEVRARYRRFQEISGVDLLAHEMPKDRPFGDSIKVHKKALLLTQAERRYMQAASEQLGKALHAFLNDILLGEANIVKEGIIPKEVMDIAVRDDETTAHYADTFDKLRGKMKNFDSYVSFCFGPDVFRNTVGLFTIIEVNVGPLGGLGDNTYIHREFKRSLPVEAKRRLGKSRSYALASNEVAKFVKHAARAFGVSPREIFRLSKIVPAELTLRELKRKFPDTWQLRQDYMTDFEHNRMDGLFSEAGGITLDKFEEFIGLFSIRQKVLWNSVSDGMAHTFGYQYRPEPPTISLVDPDSKEGFGDGSLLLNPERTRFFREYICELMRELRRKPKQSFLMNSIFADGLADSKVLFPYLPAIIKHYTGTAPLFNFPPSDLAFVKSIDKDGRIVMQSLDGKREYDSSKDELTGVVIKECGLSQGKGVTLGNEANLEMLAHALKVEASEKEGKEPPPHFDGPVFLLQEYVAPSKFDGHNVDFRPLSYAGADGEVSVCDLPWARAIESDPEDDFSLFPTMWTLYANNLELDLVRKLSRQASSFHSNVSMGGKELVVIAERGR